MRPRRATFAAGAAFTVAAAVLAASVVERLRATSSAWPSADLSTAEAAPAPAVQPARSADPEASEPAGNRHAQSAFLVRITEIANRAPFSPTRQPPAERFSLAGTVDEGRTPVDPAAPTPNVRLLGVAHFGKGDGIAAVEVEGYPPRVLRVGHSVGGLALLSVRADGATLRGPDGDMDLGVLGRGGSR